MLIAPKPPDEVARIKALQEMGILDTPINPVFERITRLTKQMFDVPVVAISIIDSERQWFKSTQGLNVCENDLNTSFCSHAILQDDIFIVPDALKDERFADSPIVTEDPHVRYYAGCPVRSEDGHKIGTLCIIDKQVRNFSPTELEALRDMASLIQDELQKYRQKYTQLKVIEELDQAKRAKLIDGLTGVWNRQGCEINLQENMLIAKEQGYNLLIGILDIDSFKKVNDTYGHNAGDEVIREVVKRMVINLDDHDLVGRWGGEEFVIMAKIENGLDEVLSRVDTARANVAAEPVLFENQQIEVSVTIGLTQFDGKSNLSLEECISKADANLYNGKNSGKNQCVFI